MSSEFWIVHYQEPGKPPAYGKTFLDEGEAIVFATERRLGGCAVRISNAEETFRWIMGENVFPVQSTQ